MSDILDPPWLNFDKKASSNADCVTEESSIAYKFYTPYAK